MCPFRVVTTSTCPMYSATSTALSLFLLPPCQPACICQIHVNNSSLNPRSLHNAQSSLARMRSKETMSSSVQGASEHEPRNKEGLHLLLPQRLQQAPLPTGPLLLPAAQCLCLQPCPERMGGS